MADVCFFRLYINSVTYAAYISTVAKSNRQGKPHLVSILKANAGCTSKGKKAPQKTNPAAKGSPSVGSEGARGQTASKPSRVYRCCHCKYTSSDGQAVLRHLRTHTRERPFECPYCSKRFTQKGSLRTHLRVHTGERPFRCPVCSRAFTQSGSLRDHLRLHTGERPFSCSLCLHSFAHKGHLTEHVRTHTGERPYRCATCDRRFSRGSLLNRHVRTHLATEKSRGTGKTASGDPRESAVPLRKTVSKPTRGAKKVPSKSDERTVDEDVETEVDVADPVETSIEKAVLDLENSLGTDSDDLSEVTYVEFEILEPSRIATTKSTAADTVD